MLGAAVRRRRCNSAIIDVVVVAATAFDCCHIQHQQLFLFAVIGAPVLLLLIWSVSVVYRHQQHRFIRVSIAIYKVVATARSVCILSLPSSHRVLQTWPLFRTHHSLSLSSLVRLSARASSEKAHTALLPQQQHHQLTISNRLSATLISLALHLHCLIYSPAFGCIVSLSLSLSLTLTLSSIHRTLPRPVSSPLLCRWCRSVDALLALLLLSHHIFFSTSSQNLPPGRLCCTIFLKI